MHITSYAVVWHRRILYTFAKSPQIYGPQLEVTYVLRYEVERIKSGVNAHCKWNNIVSDGKTMLDLCFHPVIGDIKVVEFGRLAAWLLRQGT